MKTITYTVYTATELKELFPEAFKEAHEKYMGWINEDPPWSQETCDSLFELFDTAGIGVKDYDIDYHWPSQTRVKLEMDDSTRDLCGGRAMAWLENNLLCKLRVPFEGKIAIGRTSCDGNGRKVRITNWTTRWELVKYGHRAGNVLSCPFTGYYADDYFLEKLQQYVREGCSLGDSLAWLANDCAKLIADDIENQCSEESFFEFADANDWYFTKEGKMVSLPKESHDTGHD